jgi:hypothetical protein
VRVFSDRIFEMYLGFSLKVVNGGWTRTDSDFYRLGPANSRRFRKNDFRSCVGLRTVLCPPNRARSKRLLYPLCKLSSADSTNLLVVEKWNAKIFAVFESFVYRIAAN